MSAPFRMLINIDGINVSPAAIIDFNKGLIPAISCSFHGAPMFEIIGGTSIRTRTRSFHCVEEMSYRPRKINASFHPFCFFPPSLFRNFMVKIAIRLLGPYTIGLRFCVIYKVPEVSRMSRTLSKLKDWKKISKQGLTTFMIRKFYLTSDFMF